MKESQSLLAEYVQSRSEAAFGRLMKCYVDLVYSTAMRLVRGDSHLAEDIVQTVFLSLAKKANQLPPDVMLGGWLHQTTCFVAARMLRGERRRQLRERQAAELAMETNANTIFSEIAPIMDEAVNQLREDDRKAILLRFYERLDFRRIGEQLGSNEDAAQKRVSRALDQLHSFLVQRGIGASLSAAALGTALAARAVEAAPAEFVATLAKAGLAGAAAGQATGLTLLKGMTVSKVTIGVAAAVVLAGAGWLASSWWWPWSRTKAPPLVLNGTWTRLNKPQPLGHILSGSAFALDPDGQLYVADSEGGGRIQKRDRNGNWSLMASAGKSPSGFKGGDVRVIACDTAGCLYVAERERIEKRDRKGRWTTIAKPVEEWDPQDLALDPAGNLYASTWLRGGKGGGIMLRKTDGEWVRLTEDGRELGQLMGWAGLACDAKGNLYASDLEGRRIQQRDVTGRWSEIEVDPVAVGGLTGPSGIAVDASGALYVSDHRFPTRSRLLKRDADGHWSVLATEGRELGQISYHAPLRVDPAGALYVGDAYPSRIEKYDPNGTWALVCAASTEPEILSDASCFTVDSHGSLYVLDNARQQVKKRDAQGRWTVVVDVAKELGEFYKLKSIAVDQQDNLHVVDSLNLDGAFARVMTRDSHGEWEVCMPPGPGIGQSRMAHYLSVDAADNLYVIDRTFDAKDNQLDRIQKRDREGRWTVVAVFGVEPDPQRGLGAAPSGIGGLYGMSAAPDGSIYIAGDHRYDSPSSWRSRVWKRDSNGRWRTVAEFDHEMGQYWLSMGTAMATDSFGRFYISDNVTKKVRIRDVNGKWSELSEGASGGHSELSSGSLTGVVVDPQGIVYLAANNPPRVFRWTPQTSAKKGLRQQMHPVELIASINQTALAHARR